MMLPKAETSLGGRLSAYFVIMTFLGLLAVCSAIYFETAAHLKERQTLALKQYVDIMQHLASGTDAVTRDDFVGKLDDLLGKRTDVAMILQAANGDAVARLGSVGPHSRDSTFRLVLAGAPTTYINATVSVDLSADEHLLAHMAVVLTIGVLVGSALVSLVGLIVVRQGLAPVSKLVQQLDHLKLSTLDSRIDGSHQPTELQPLVRQFNVLLTRLRTAYEQLKGFNADVAHELRTPLAVMTANSQLALRGSHSSAYLRDAIGTNLEYLDRMSIIINDMLFLAQADRGVEARRVAVDSLQSICQAVIDYHSDAFDERQQTISISGDAGGLYDASLLKRALSNLLENASRHGTPQSLIRIKIEHANNAVSLSVENFGRTIHPKLLTTMFQRFSRGDDSLSSSTINHGLGLSIVAAIAKMHGGYTNATSSEGLTSVSIVIPDDPKRAYFSSKILREERDAPET